MVLLLCVRLLMSLWFLSGFPFAASSRANGEDDRDTRSWMLGAVSVIEVGFIASGHESFVIDEKNDGGDWDDAVFFVSRRGSVVKFEAFLEFSIDRGDGVFKRVL